MRMCNSVIAPIQTALRYNLASLLKTSISLTYHRYTSLLFNLWGRVASKQFTDRYLTIVIRCCNNIIPVPLNPYFCIAKSLIIISSNVVLEALSYSTHLVTKTTSQQLIVCYKFIIYIAKLWGTSPHWLKL